MLRILIQDDTSGELGEVLRSYQSFFEWKLAGLSLLDRWKREHPKARFFYRGVPSDTGKKDFLLSNHPELLPDDGKDYDLVYHESPFTPWNLLQKIASLLEETLSHQKDWKKFRQKYKVRSGKYEIVGKDKNLYLHPSVQVYPQVVFDTSKGPILIEEGVKISPFSFLEGPLYIGRNCQIDNAKIGGGCLVGEECRLGGEIENSIVLDYTNKHHEGFLGHSFVSSWVNLGALATTSDLKNNYGIVKLRLPNQEIQTGTIKFGSWIGAFSKIAIGTMLNTGAVVELGCNLVESRVSGYRSPFTWIDPESGFYRLEAFLADSKKIMARRRINMTETQESYLRSYFERRMQVHE